MTALDARREWVDPRNDVSAGASTTESSQLERSLRRAAALFAAMSLLCACASEPPPSGAFVEVAAAAGVGYRQARPGTLTFTPTALSASGGAAVGDYDADGLPDLYVTRVDDTDILYRNRGDGTFIDVTAAAGLTLNAASNGAAWGDIDNDADLDLYVSVIGATRYLLFVNDGAGHFDEEGLERNAVLANDQAHMGWSVSFGDYDRDGWLDLYLSERQEVFGEAVPSPHHSRLLRNLGETNPGHYEDTTDRAGVSYEDYPYEGARSHTFMTTFADMDDDGWPDLLVTADFETSRLFWNDGDGTFTDGTTAAGVGLERNGMGSAVGDYDGDGLLDWFVDSISCPDCDRTMLAFVEGNRLYRNRGDRTFADTTLEAGVARGWWAWGTAFLDFDNDGDLDLVQTNGIGYLNPIYDRFRQKPIRFWVNRGDGTFDERADELGVRDTADGKGLMVFDYDDDGDLDFLVVHHGGPAGLWKNQVGNRNAWCRVKLIGREDNRHGIGARVILRADPGGPEQVTEIRASGQYLGQSEAVAHFGMGPGARPADEIRVRWPTTGTEQVLRNVPCNRTVVVEEPDR